MKLRVILSLFMASFFACNNEGADGEADKDSNAVKKTSIDSAANNTIVQPKDIYGVVINDTIIFLRQWDSTINLEKLLGTPLKKNTKELDLNSDTFAGSFIKNLEFPGLKLKLFSPKQNGKTFWIQEIIPTDGRYRTINGIGIGDSLEKIKQAYPSLQKFPGNSDNMYYVANEGYEKSIEMEFEKDILVKLRMYFMMN
jgi:hypothetical protein